LSYIELENVATSTITPIAEANLDCDFDSQTFCAWENEVGVQLKWGLNKGPTSTILTGPTVDHTTGTREGYYIYVNALDPQSKPNASARFTSPIVKLEPSVGGCLKFYYHMFGPDVYQLNLYLANKTNLISYGKPVWQKKLNKGDKWLFGHFYAENLLIEDNFVRFIIEGVVITKFYLKFFR
jgi:hypothetical protein